MIIGIYKTKRMNVELIIILIRIEQFILSLMEIVIALLKYRWKTPSK